MRFTVVAVLTGVLAGSAATLNAQQSLAAVAKKEEERRKDAPTSKTYTNKDLKAVPPPPGPAASTAGSGADTKPATDAKAGADARAGSDAKGKTEVKDQTYWSTRIKTLREQLDRDKTYTDALQSRINALTADFAGRDDPAQRDQIGVDRQKAITELDRLKKQVALDTQAIIDLEEEARRAGVPPGWLR